MVLVVRNVGIWAGTRPRDINWDVVMVHWLHGRVVVFLCIVDDYPCEVPQLPHLVYREEKVLYQDVDIWQI